MTRRAIPALLTTAVLLAAPVLVPASAGAAAPAWSEPVALSLPGQDAYGQHVAIDRQGDAVAVWQRFDGTHPVVQAATRRAGVPWSPPVDLSGPGVPAQLPRVAMDAEGEAVATWQTIGAEALVQVATLAPDASEWSPPLTISAPGSTSSSPEVAIDPGGDAVVVWSGVDGTGTATVQEATRPAGGSWTIPVKLSAPGQNAELPTVALDPAGGALVAWLRSDGSHLIVQARSRPPGSIWGFTANLSAAGEDADLPALAIDAGGDAVVAWQRSNGTYDVVQAARRTGEGGAWSAPVTLSVAGEEGYAPTAAVDSAGDATVAWYGFVGSASAVKVADSAAGSAAWSAPATLSETGSAGTEPALAVDPAGDGVLAWSERSAGTQTLRTARRGPGETAWGAAIGLAPAGAENKHVSVAIDAGGDAVAVWRHSDGAEGIVEASMFELPRPASGTPVVTEPAPVTVAVSGGATAGGATSGGEGSSGAPTKGDPRRDCPAGRSLRRMRVRVGKGTKRESKTVSRCVKPGAARHRRRPRHHRVKGK